MVEDPHERTRAILWCLADARPDMPVLEALGHLKAIEAQLDVLEAEREAEAQRELAKNAPIGTASKLLSGVTADGTLRGMATAGAKPKDIAKQVQKTFLCTPAEAAAAAETMLSLFGPGPLRT